MAYVIVDICSPTRSYLHSSKAVRSDSSNQWPILVLLTRSISLTKFARVEVSTTYRVEKSWPSIIADYRSNTESCPCAESVTVV
jgi:hypothetical protein